MNKQTVGLLAAVLGSMATVSASAAEITVLASNAIKEAYIDFAPLFEKASGHKLNTTFDGTANIVKKIRSGESFDMVVLATPQLNDLMKEGKVVAGSVVDAVRSGIGAAVPAGAPKPDLSSAESIRKTLLAAKGIGYSSGPSGVFLEALFKRWGIADAIKDKVKRSASGVGVASLILSGEVDIAFQQVSELLHAHGVQYAGALPPDIQHITAFAAGIPTAAKQPDAGRALIKFILSPAALPHITHAGLEQGGS
jgi:molybdate transport system substrate-binding protein